MTSQLTPQQISSLWRVIKFAISESLPPIAGEAPDKLNRILTNLIQGTMQCWASYDYGEELELRAIALTTLVEDQCSGTRSLLVYSLYSFIPTLDWVDAFKPVGKWAIAKECSRIIAYSDNERVKQIVEKQLKGEAKYWFMTIPLPEA